MLVVFIYYWVLLWLGLLWCVFWPTGVGLAVTLPGWLVGLFESHLQCHTTFATELRVPGTGLVPVMQFLLSRLFPLRTADCDFTMGDGREVPRQWSQPSQLAPTSLHTPRCK